jgi:hypothetical protein
MYIEFQLPNGGMYLARANYLIDQALQQWSTCYDILYDTKNIKYFKRVTFSDERFYSLFAMTWNPDRKYSVLSKWRIVSDLNNKTEFDSRV